MKIQALLNPLCGGETTHQICGSPPPSSLPHTEGSIQFTRRHRIPKDAPVFSEGIKTVGIINYPPHENKGDQELAAHHRRFKVYPVGEIATKGVRHIPYNSEKKDFLYKTGRDAFEMFQYTYKRPGDEKEYVVVWDYNVGLVRMTPFFKSCKHTKTVPAKALRENDGLKDISYSITGGALVCQGYWMPYQAAKAVAATFCYDIRWALTPVFGNDFPSQCIHPEDPSFAKFVIDPDIVKYCTMETNRFRKEGSSYCIATQKSSSPIATPKLKFETPLWRPVDIESGYWTGTDRSDKAIYSPSPTGSSAMSSPVSPHYLRLTQSPAFTSEAFYEQPYRPKRTNSKVGYIDHYASELVTRPQTANTAAAHIRPQMEMVKVEEYSQVDVEAAEVLWSLYKPDRTLPRPTKRTRRGSTI